MGKGSAYVAVKDVLIKLKEGECALGTEQRRRENDDAAVKDALI